MRVDTTFPEISIDPRIAVHITLQGGKKVELTGTGDAGWPTFATLVPESEAELELDFLQEYCTANKMRLATGFELAKLLRNQLDGFDERRSPKIDFLAQCIALGDTYDDGDSKQYWFIADCFWDYQICLVEKPELHFKIAVIQCPQ